MEDGGGDGCGPPHPRGPKVALVGDDDEERRGVLHRLLLERVEVKRAAADVPVGDHLAVLTLVRIEQPRRAHARRSLREQRGEVGHGDEELHVLESAESRFEHGPCPPEQSLSDLRQLVMRVIDPFKRILQRLVPLHKRHR